MGRGVRTSTTLDSNTPGSPNFAHYSRAKAHPLRPIFQRSFHHPPPLRWIRKSPLRGLWSSRTLTQRRSCAQPVTPRDRCARCLPIISLSLLACCILSCHHVHCIIMFSKPASVRVPPVPSVVRSEPNHTCTRPRHVRNSIL